VTGHREPNAALAANRDGVLAALDRLFTIIADTVAAAAPMLGGMAPPRLHCLLVDGVDQLAAAQALARGWQLVAPLPFGEALNLAINAYPENAADARRLLAGQQPECPATAARAATIRRFADQAQLFTLADRDAEITELFLAIHDAPHDRTRPRAYAFAASERVQLAGQIVIEQSDVMIGVWDGASTTMVGGSGHTIALALAAGSPVIWIDARAPDRWHVLDAPETLAVIMAGASLPPDDPARVAALIGAALRPAVGPRHHIADHGHANGAAALDHARWFPHSTAFWHGYRRLEALFGADDMAGRLRSLRTVYEPPAAIAGGSRAGWLQAAAALPGQDPALVPRLATGVFQRFAWADGVSAHLSDTYRGGMILNFLFGAFAVIVGIAYLPLATTDDKWAFALVEMALLAGILAITFFGQRSRWHGRWFETRRVAEYLRQAPIMLLLGVARPPGRWPRGTHTSWPEHYARQVLRDIGLPRIAVTGGYLHAALSDLLLPVVISQRDYHIAKAERLGRAHRRLDAVSEAMFTAAVIAVGCYLALKLGGALGIIGAGLALSLSKFFTFFGVLLPTLGGAVSGMRFFGDFERFSAISEVTAEKLDGVARRLTLLLAAPPDAIDFARAAELAHATDDIVISEIESWQAVFGGKHITVPV
jgi:hypothetical protein